MQENQPVSQPEIDLYYFVGPVVRLLKHIWAALFYYFRLLWRNAGLFMIIFLLCVLAGVATRFIIKPLYEVDAVFISHTLTAPTLLGFAEEAGSPSYSFEKTLGLSTEGAMTIRKFLADTIRVRTVRKSYDSVMFYNISDTLLPGIRITLRLNDLRYLDSMETGIVRYLSRSPYAVRRFEARRQALQRLKSSLERKVADLDSTQKIINSSIIPRREFSTGDALNPVDGYRASIQYSRQLIAINQEMAILDDIEVIKPFNKPDYFNYPDYFVYFVTGALVGLLLALLLTPLLGRKPHTRLPGRSAAAANP